MSDSPKLVNKVTYKKAKKVGTIFAEAFFEPVGGTAGDLELTSAGIGKVLCKHFEAEEIDELERFYFHSKAGQCFQRLVGLKPMQAHGFSVDEDDHMQKARDLFLLIINPQKPEVRFPVVESLGVCPDFLPAEEIARLKREYEYPQDRQQMSIRAFARVIPPAEMTAALNFYQGAVMKKFREKEALIVSESLKVTFIVHNPALVIPFHVELPTIEGSEFLKPGAQPRSRRHRRRGGLGEE